MKTKIGVICSDMRYLYMIDKLLTQNYEIKALGLPQNHDDKRIWAAESWTEVCSDVDALILPMGGIDKDYCVSSRLTGESWLFDKQALEDKTILFSGIYNPNFAKLGITEDRVCLLMNDESFAIYNSVSTGEGAIALAINHSNITIHSSLCLTLGYGRCGKYIAKLLANMGARSVVVVRKSRDIAAAYRDQLQGIYYDELGAYLAEADFVFNTVPACVLSRSVLAQAKQDCTIIDIASYPGGTDFEAAQEYGLTTFLALSLPGKVAPKTSGDFMAKTIMQYLTRR